MNAVSTLELVETLNPTVSLNAPSLNMQCAARHRIFLATLPAMQRKTLLEAERRLLQSDVAQGAVRAGDKAPDFLLDTPSGESFYLAEALRHGPVILSFYRGGWCPFCNLEMQALVEHHEAISQLGATLVAIAPEQPVDQQLSIEKLGIPFPLLVDEDNRLAERYGLVMIVEEALRPLYQQWGYDLPAYNDDDSWTLPLPASYVIDRHGTVAAACVNRDYSQRMEPGDIIRALRTLDE